MICLLLGNRIGGNKETIRAYQQPIINRINVIFAFVL